MPALRFLAGHPGQQWKRVAVTERTSPDGPTQAPAAVAFANEWAAEIVDTGPVGQANRDTDAGALVHDITVRLIESLRAQPFEPAVAAECGAALVRHGLVGPHVLARSVRAVSRDLLAAADLPATDHWRGRLAELVGEMTAGYVGALPERTLTEHHVTGDPASRPAAIENPPVVTDALFHAVLNTASVGIAITDLDGTVQLVNPALADILGFPRHQLTGRSITESLRTDDPSVVATAFSLVVSGESSSYSSQVTLTNHDEQPMWARLTLSLACDDENVPRYVIVGVEDASELHLLQKNEVTRALRDQLTGLPNRTQFMSTLNATLAAADEHDTIALCYLDLDGFKIINDGVGPDIGDVVLRRVADILTSSFPPPDSYVARLGGDGFAVLINDAGGRFQVSERISAALSELAEPVYYDRETGVAVSASVGIVEVSATAMTAADLVRAAELTVHRAKKQGKAQWELFDQHLDQRDRDRFKLGAAIPGALENSEFAVSYQPVLRLTDDTTAGVRVLLSWDHPQRGSLKPADFLYLAEEIGFIVPLGQWMLEHVCAQLGEWHHQFGDAAPTVTIGLTARLAREQDLIRIMRQVLDSTGAPSDKLRLGIPSGVVIDERGEVLENLIALRDSGIRVVIKGFGTGTAGLVDLGALPVDGVVVPPSVISALRTAEDDSPIERHLRHLIQLGEALGLDVVADGVDTPRLVERLRRTGFRFGVGTALGTPRPAHEVEREIAARVP